MGSWHFVDSVFQEHFELGGKCNTEIVGQCFDTLNFAKTEQTLSGCFGNVGIIITHIIEHDLYDALGLFGSPVEVFDL